MSRGERGILFAAMPGVKLRCSAIDLKMENVGPIVMAGEIVPQLHGDPELEIALRIKDAFLGSHRSGDDPAVGRDDDAPSGAIGIAQFEIETADAYGVDPFDPYRAIASALKATEPHLS